MSRRVEAGCEPWRWCREPSVESDADDRGAKSVDARIAPYAAERAAYSSDARLVRSAAPSRASSSLARYMMTSPVPSETETGLAYGAAPSAGAREEVPSVGVRFEARKGGSEALAEARFDVREGANDAGTGAAEKLSMSERFVERPEEAATSRGEEALPAAGVLEAGALLDAGTCFFDEKRVFSSIWRSGGGVVAFVLARGRLDVEVAREADDLDADAGGAERAFDAFVFEDVGRDAEAVQRAFDDDDEEVVAPTASRVEVRAEAGSLRGRRGG